MSQKHNHHGREAFAIGASSAFDMSGVRFLRSDLCPPQAWTETDAEGAIGRDFARVMRTLRRSTRYVALALDAGLDVEQLRPGCTMRTAGTSATSEPALRRT